MLILNICVLVLQMSSSMHCKHLGEINIYVCMFVLLYTAFNCASEVVCLQRSAASHCERGRNNKNVQNYLQIVCSSVWACGFAKDVPLNSSESSLIKVNYIFIGFCSVIEIHWVEGALKVRLWIFMSMIRNMRLFRDNFPFPLARHRIDIVIIAIVVTAFVAFQCVASAWKGPLALWWFAITATYKWELDLRRAKKDLNWVVKLQIKAKLASSKVLKYTARKHFGSPRWLFYAI